MGARISRVKRLTPSGDSPALLYQASAVISVLACSIGCHCETGDDAGAATLTRFEHLAPLGEDPHGWTVLPALLGGT